MLTTINPPNYRLREFIEVGYEVVVVGDSKTDDELWTNQPSGIHYLSLSEQRDIAPDLSDAIGAGTYARKNFGYLFAMHSGAETIWETDDDNFVRSGVGDPLDFLSNSRGFLSPPGVVFNPYSFFASGAGIWPRGFPLRLVESTRKEKFTELNLQTYPFGVFPSEGVLQLLVSGEPDVDAIYRLVIESRARNFDASTDIIALHETSWAPANTQATIWLGKKSFPYLYVPRWVNMRFSDILKMYVYQSSNPLFYAGFLMEQERNQHDLLLDFADEITLHLKVESLLSILSEHRQADIIEKYELLEHASICDSRELEALSIYQEKVVEITHS